MRNSAPERLKNAWTDKKFTRLSKTAEKLLGWPGRMLYHSKSMKQPTTIFNANIFNKKALKIWAGDLEIERDREALLKLSNRLGAIYILWEMDGRFLEVMPTLEYVKSTAAVTVEDGAIMYSAGFQEYVGTMKGRIDDRRRRR